MSFQIKLNSFNLLLLGSPHQHASLCPGEFPRCVALHFRLHLWSHTWYWTVEILYLQQLSESLTLAFSLMRGAKPTQILDSQTSLNNQLIKVSVWLFFATFSNEITGDSQEGNKIFRVWSCHSKHYLWLSTQVIAVCSTICTGNPIAWLSQHSPGDVLVV